MEHTSNSPPYLRKIKMNELKIKSMFFYFFNFKDIIHKNCEEYQIDRK